MTGSAMFEIQDLFTRVVCLPRRDSNVLEAFGLVFKHPFDLLQCLASCFRKHEEYMDKHRNAEDTKDDVCSPLNVDKGWWNEIAECKVESPIGLDVFVSVSNHERSSQELTEVASATALPRTRSG